MKPAENQDPGPANRKDVIAGAVTAVILVIITAWLVLLLF